MYSENREEEIRGGRRGGRGERFRRGDFPFGGRGPFGPGGPGGGPPWGRGHRGGGGRARRGNVRASILALLKERPMHGYEMIQEIGERTAGTWRPSPGSVYPTLQLLEDEGLISSESTGGKRLFQLTEAGSVEAEQVAEAPWADSGREGDFAEMQESRQALMQLMQAVQQVMSTGSEEQRGKAMEVVNETRKKLYLILAEG